jgi:integrase
MMIGSKRRDMGLGGYPEASLADARARGRVARDKVRAGVDPIAEALAARSALRAAQAAALTFGKAAELFIEANRSGWRNAKHTDQWGNSLARYVDPFIGALNVEDVGRAHVLLILEQPVGDEGKFWESRTETADRVRGRIEKILDWAKGRGHRTGDNPAAWKGNLDAVLPKAKRIKKVEHHPAVSLKQMPAFFAELKKREGNAARALELVILTAARSGEVRGMTWSEIDINNNSWIVPANRMKANKEHRVPLSSMAVELLESLPRHEGSDLVFPSPRGGLMSDMSLTAVMRRMERKEVPHGFRSTFRDWAAELTHYPRDMAEMALAHSLGNAVEAAYRRGDMLEKRRQMMEDWASFARDAIKATFLSAESQPQL